MCRVTFIYVFHKYVCTVATMAIQPSKSYHQNVLE